MKKRHIEIVLTAILILMVLYLALNGSDLSEAEVCIDPNHSAVTDAIQAIDDEFCGLEHDMYRQETQQKAILEKVEQ
jgi:hypothetical protein